MKSFVEHDVCFTMNVVDEFDLVNACRRYISRAYPTARLVLLAGDGNESRIKRWMGYEDEFTTVVATKEHLYDVRYGGLVVHTHLEAFLKTEAVWWFKIDPDTFVRRAIGKPLPENCFFGTIQTRAPWPSLQGGCIGGHRASVEKMFQSKVLLAEGLLDFEKTWAGNNSILLKRARSGLVSFDFVHAWACEQVGISIVDHPEIRSYWQGPPRRGWRYAITHPHKDLDVLDPDAPDDVNPAAEDLRRLVQGAVPAGAVVAVISKGDEEMLELENIEAWHFPRNEFGSYLGYHPVDSREAVEHLEFARRSGAGFLAIPEPSLWWLDHYEDFHGYLRSHYMCVAEHMNKCIAFDLTKRVLR